MDDTTIMINYVSAILDTRDDIVNTISEQQKRMLLLIDELLMQRDSLRVERSELLLALRSLANEARGFVAFAEREAHGNTNIAVLRDRINHAETAIAKAENRKVPNLDSDDVA